MKYWFLSILIVFTFLVQAQSSSNRKAQAFFEKAGPYIEKQEYVAAAQNLEAALAEDPQFLSALILLGDVNRFQKKYIEAKILFQKAFLLNKNIAPAVIFNLAEMEIATREYDQAKQHFNDFLIQANPSD